MDRVTSSCIASLWIDKYEVTNAQYRKFWESLPPKQHSNTLTFDRLYPLS